MLRTLRAARTSVFSISISMSYRERLFILIAIDRLNGIPNIWALELMNSKMTAEVQTTPPFQGLTEY
jgi:hypothetical protein